MMKLSTSFISVSTVTILFLLSTTETNGFQSYHLSHSKTKTKLFGYIPDGFTAESYKKFKEEEKKKKEQRNLGRMGPRGFKSRSFQSFQEAVRLVCLLY